LLLSIIVYLNVLDGAFVYDDVRQIGRNTLIQDSSLFWKALTSDVWAAKGGTTVSSNYWRPTFVTWLVFNFKLFGTDRPLAGTSQISFLIRLSLLSHIFSCAV